MTLLQDLEARLASALAITLGEPASAAVTSAADLRFGDYQTNAAMVLAKQRNVQSWEEGKDGEGGDGVTVAKFKD